MSAESELPRDQKIFHKLLGRYAACILELGVALRKGQPLLISALTVHRDLALALATEAYRRGASFVEILYQDELLTKTLLEAGDNAALEFVPKSVVAAHEEALERRGAFIALSGREDLDAFRGITPDRQSRAFLAFRTRLDFFYQKIYTNRIKWCMAAGATPGAAAAVFPGLPAGRARDALWEQIFTICRVRERNPVAAWRAHAELLEQRARTLNGLRLRELALTSPTCDLKLALHERARWRGGFSVTADGERFLANLPTEEVFTVPDCRSLEGRFRSTRPLVYKNVYVPSLALEFRGGNLVSVTGGRGVGELRRILDSDPAHRRAGEIALVDSDSAVARSGLVFHDLLYDENAQTHLALGSGYTECLEGAAALSREERERAGFNSGTLHIDFMLGSPELEVTGRDAAGNTHALIRDGRFVLD